MYGFQFLGGRLEGSTYIDVARKTREVLCMITWGMLLGAKVLPIDMARAPIITKSSLQFAAA